MSNGETPDIRATIADLLRPVPGREIPGHVTWVPVPGTTGVVPACGSAGQMLSEWALGTSAFTVADLHAATDRLKAEGLGHIAVVAVRGGTSIATCTAWGATAHGAVARLAEDLAVLRSLVRAAADALLPSPSWAPSETRIHSLGSPSAWAAISAPALGKTVAALEARRDTTRALFAVHDDAVPWREALARALDVDLAGCAAAMGRAHAADPRPDGFSWKPVGRPDQRGGVRRAELYRVGVPGAADFD